MEQPQEAPEARRATEEEKDLVQRLLGSVGVVDALLGDLPINPTHEDSQWAS